MKKNYIFIFLSVSLMAGFAFAKMSKKAEIAKFAYEKSHINESGAPAGKTGAPGEGTCTDCHSGSVQSGTGFNNLMLFDSDNVLVTEYTPGSTYTVVVSMNSTAAKKGFEATARISSDNTTAGTMASVSGSTQIKTGSASKKYATHINTSTTSLSGWTFTWTAPSTDVGNVIFYLATNETNNNDGSSGDIIRTSQHAYLAVDNAGIKEKAVKAPFSAAFNAIKQSIMLDLVAKQGSVYSLNVVDLTGKSVFYKRLGSMEDQVKEEIFLPESIRGGLYVLHLFEDNTSFTQKIYISK